MFQFLFMFGAMFFGIALGSAIKAGSILGAIVMGGFVLACVAGAAVTNPKETP